MRRRGFRKSRCPPSLPTGGDLIDSAEGIQLYSIDQLRDALAGKKPGDKVELGVYRGDKHQTVTVKLGRQPTS